MFAFSLGKILLLLVLVVVAWSAFRYVSRVEAVRRTLREEIRRRQAPPARAAKMEAEDLVKCTGCGAYVAARGATPCGRPECPWR